ncbi:polysaccharide pyruvyl transferase family protein [Clostridium perfringens]|uniref:polysaccharide pyruvyl transferase family protein n=1 Tax=Clostridium perfringens TaxID=1502 RepID=UPI0010EBDBFD|nr:polysaccharide pyruvyl transferase family protein [Clostridium perfringens]MDB2046934.1 polysaccharide pyruvyl transferase family protein [Clostridium perfringens]MDB2057981.1 polysaccharide pyruvyl transferase family protein [Clostridium perfringens]MDK0612324.1 polysaccharide pyruvyl transferase family protein [Clostridium perfringens]MDK0644885.1 polysaccharide pyruvyl transferase family protein [Clostridium perfringens]MDM0771743.1 polysaccharide pyruvyl transferase family protein [Clos
MSKIGIVTIIDNNNYGNRLQNYAVQEILKKKGFIVETLKNNEFSNFRKNYLLRKIRYSWNSSTYSKDLLRKNNFEEFNKKIIFSEKKINPFSKCNYDYVIVGSDQVWNPNFSRLSDVDLLTFAEPKKRISFSASFGVEQLPEDISNKVAKEFKKFKGISVREDKGKDIINKMIERSDVEVLIDPTMMLTKEEWSVVSKKPNVELSKPFILRYFLSKPNVSVEEKINKIADENNMEIIDVLDPKTKEIFSSGPSEFLYLISHSSLVCTDSFHACVFSILFDKPFLVFERNGNINKMNSRIVTLLNKFKLQDKLPGNVLDDDIFNHNYFEANKILEVEREKVSKFLDKYIEDNDEN